MMSGESEWKNIKRRKRPRNRNQHPSLSKIDLRYEMIRRSISDLVETDFCRKCIDKLREAMKDLSISNLSELICYGLGSPVESAASRHQLALLMIIRACLSPSNLTLEELIEMKGVGIDFWIGNTSLMTCLAFDPIFSDDDKELLQRLGISLIREDEKCCRRVDQPTLFYMIHCDKLHLDNVLRSNWSLENLPNVVLLGNSFSSICERTLRRHLVAHYRYLQQANSSGVCEEFPLEAWGKHDDVFNDTSLHHFPSHRLVRFKEKLKDSRSLAEPDYE